MPVNPYLYFPAIGYEGLDDKIVNMAVGDDAWVIYNGYPVMIQKNSDSLLSITYSYCDDNDDTSLLSFAYESTGNGFKVYKNVSCYDLSQDDMTTQDVISDFNNGLIEYGYEIDEVILENGEAEGDYAGVFKRKFAWDKVIAFIQI